MTFNIDPVGATLLVALLGLGYRAWDSTHKRIGDNHTAAMEKLDEYHNENKVRLRELADEHEDKNGAIHARIDKHGEKIEELRRDIDGHGYRIAGLERK